VSSSWGVELPAGRVRRAGAGRKRATAHDPKLLAALDALVDPDSRGDPQSPLRWTRKSTRQLADALSAHPRPCGRCCTSSVER
jgi:hypothetical protein